jgi:GT2 family glycosyltransferase
MIAFGCCVSIPDRYASIAEPHLARIVREAQDGEVEVWLETERVSLAACYNRLISRARDAGEALECLVLLHDDTELRDPKALAKLREAMALPSAGVAGVIGGRGMSGSEWWTARTRFGYTTDCNGRQCTEGGAGAHEVDGVDGLFLALSPAAVAVVRLCETPGFHSYDAECCFRARAAGLRVRTLEIEVHHNCRPPIPDKAAFAMAGRAFCARWFPVCRRCGRTVECASPTGRVCQGCGQPDPPA